jgi:hypothetical protein
VLADWPVDLREAWGRLADRLAYEGHMFPEDERLAFEAVNGEVSNEPG